MDFIKKHKKLIIIITILVLILVLLFSVIHSLMPDTRKSVWGSRISDIATHPISDEEISSVKETCTSNEFVSSVTYRLSGRKMIFIITVKDKTSKESAQNLLKKILEKISDDVKGYYDIEVSFVCENEENSEYPFSAYKHKTSDSFNVG